MIQARTIYTRTTKEQLKEYCRNNKLTIVAFREPIEGELFIGKPYGNELIIYNHFCVHIKTPRLIVTRDAQ